jgi:hypothetical protein
MRIRPTPIVLAVIFTLSAMRTAQAQPLGTFRWQQQPYCNVVNLSVVQDGTLYRLDGYDDQCDAATRASAVGLAFFNPDGTAGIGLTIVTTPGGTPLHIDATVSLATISGTWRDSAGNTGPFVLTPGAAVPGSPRPSPRAVFPAGMSAGGTTVTDVGTPVSPTDAANKGYVDTVAAIKANTADVRAALLAERTWGARILNNGSKGSTGHYTSSNTSAGNYSVTFDVTGLQIPSRGFPSYQVTPRCAGHTVDIPLISTATNATGHYNNFGLQIATRNSAGTLTNCELFVQVTLPHPDSPDSPVPPFLRDGSEPGVTCTANGDTTTCISRSQP